MYKNVYNLIHPTGFLNTCYDKICLIKKACHAIVVDVCLVLRKNRFASFKTLTHQWGIRQRREIPWK